MNNGAGEVDRPAGMMHSRTRDQIDKRLDAPRENQLARTPSERQEVEPERGPAKSRGPNRYAERAKQAEPDRAKERDPARKPQRGLDR